MKSEVGDIINELRSCSLKGDLQWAKRIHAKVTEIGCEANVCIGGSLIKTYAKCGCMASARRVFDSIRRPSLISWNTLLLGYAANGDGRQALELFSTMKNTSGQAPDSFTYVAALKACAYLAAKGERGDALKRGREIHSEAVQHLDAYVQGTLIDLYSKCGSMAEAQAVFNTLRNPDVVSWTALALGYAENGEGATALDLFTRMKNTPGCKPDVVTYIAALKACSCLAANGEKDAALRRGRAIHSEASSSSCINFHVQNTLIDMYGKCGSMVEARRVFDGLRKPDVVSWNALLLGYVENGEGCTALDMFARMKNTPGCSPDSVTYVAALKACSCLAEKDCANKEAALQQGREIQLLLGSDIDPYVESALVDMYAKCGCMTNARQIFDTIQVPDAVSWNALLHGYAENGEARTTLELFNRMRSSSGCVPNAVTYFAVLKACGLIGALAFGRKLHAEMNEEVPSYVVTCLVDFYAKCGSLLEASEVYDAYERARVLSTLNALLAGYARFGDCTFVFELFEAQSDAGLQPDAVTFVAMLMCCSHAGLVDKAKDYLSAMRLQYGITPDISHYNCVIDVLGRANKLQEAIEVVQRMQCEADVVTWMTLLGACRKWRNADIGRWAFQSLVAIDKKRAPAYVLMSHISGTLGLPGEEQQEKALISGNASVCDQRLEDDSPVVEEQHHLS